MHTQMKTLIQIARYTSKNSLEQIKLEIYFSTIYFIVGKIDTIMLIYIYL